ncbi:hypothetical protein SAMN03159496_04650 [Rhizobium sp. NFR07]|uniref:Yip1 family protein n=1 Tax=Rhizobium sp. NFR07 TaxID=1566262 RepID=UPI0008EF4182|nr:Yip1 family protein [Rhizobium sp. NFR07]SFB52429.1 hypothetical protein SAMN03159496_04650 [Rhizobium sp. NFR07]
MPSTQTMVPKVNDRALVQFFRDACAIIKAPNIQLTTINGAGSVTVAVDDVEPDNFPSDGITTVINARAMRDHFSITVDRGSGANADGLLYDSLTISNHAPENGRPDLALPDDIFTSLRIRIGETFGRDDEGVASLFKNPKLFRDVLASHHRQNAQLQQMALDIGKEASRARIELEVDFARRREALEAEATKARERADAKIREREFELLAERDRISALQKELDDRSNTHARRELHRDLKAKIAQRGDSLKVTPETKANRRPIHVIVVCVLMALFALIVFLTIEFSQVPTGASTLQVAVAGIKPATATLAMLGIVAWYLRWMNRWFERYADAEFQLKQFDLDIDRASWVVEAALEWKLSQDRPMPEHLLETISRNLFSKSEKDDGADMHPADYLASAILGRASALNLKLPGGEVSLTGKDIRGLQKD